MYIILNSSYSLQIFFCNLITVVVVLATLFYVHSYVYVVDSSSVNVQYV